ncbi:Uncharacterised protein [Legionella lansingensis]|uniref:Substrate of the Dot/Icm secretion system n=1 Tax=Legionella lansingensis TaxID=45067 RepID=A0A0W0VXQ0_9GAMM|nr:hypothetical protein [Legionella lansingensis]KTD24765.1 hypothetical protein Llan_0327 [Legionella lansingensis]SNV48858.1 Uncharacterised protein [Legionella lansingensis]
MGYIVPEYSDLQKKTDDLEDYFNRLCKRYISLRYEELRSKVTALEKKYDEKITKKTSWFSFSNPELRRDQTACIAQLLPKLPEAGEKEQINLAQNILQGAIFYRYKRITVSYQGVAYSFLGYTPENSALSRTLEEEFHLLELDDETLATCCEAYLAYLRQPDKSRTNKKVGDLFPYIQEDGEFYKKLEQVITVAKIGAQAIRQQLQIIAFVKSVAHALRETDKGVDDIFTELSEVVLEKLKAEPYLTKQDIVSLLRSKKTPKNQIFVEIFILSLPRQGVTKSGVQIEEDWIKPFKDYMVEALSITSNYVLIGSYVMALSLCKTERPKLKDALNHTLGAKGVNQLDDDTIALALEAFKTYVEIPGRPAMDCKAWNLDTGEEHMRQDLIELYNRVMKRTASLAC